MSENVSIRICPACKNPITPEGFVLVPRSALKRTLKGPKTKHYDKRKGRKTRIEKNPQVKKFLLENEDKLTYDQMRSWLIENVGKELTPSRSAISRFFQIEWSKKEKAL